VGLIDHNLAVRFHSNPACEINPDAHYLPNFRQRIDIIRTVLYTHQTRKEETHG